MPAAGSGERAAGLGRCGDRGGGADGAAGPPVRPPCSPGAAPRPEAPCGALWGSMGPGCAPPARCGGACRTWALCMGLCFPRRGREALVWGWGAVLGPVFKRALFLQPSW